MRWVITSALLFAVGCSTTEPPAPIEDAGDDTKTVDVGGADVANDLRVDADGSIDIGVDIAPDLVASCNGCIIETTFIGSFTQAEIAAAVPPSVIVENGYSIHWVTYESNGRVAHATVTIPSGLVNPPPEGWSIAVNNPGTVGVADKCAVAFTLTGSGLSGYFGARGFVGVTVDYPGLGTEGDHPYLDADVEAAASLDAIRATATLLGELGTPYAGRSVMGGLSQGGHATLAAAALQPTYAPELDVRAFGVVGPASVFLEHWQPGMTFDGEHLVYHALLSWAFWRNYGGGTSPFALPNINALMNDHCNFATDTPALVDVLGTSRTAIFTQTFIDAFVAGDFSQYPFMESGFSQNRLSRFDQSSPIRVYQGDADIVVLESGTAELVAELQQGTVDLQYIVVPGGGHTDVAFSFLAQPQLRTEDVITWFRESVD